MNARLVPEVGSDDAPFWESGADGVLRLQQCASCTRFQHPPAPRCHHCLSEDIAFTAVSGRGELYSVSVNHQSWLPGLEVPYAVVVVAPDEAPDLRLVSRMAGLVDPGAPPRIGDRVEVRFDEVDGVWLPLFVPAGAGA
ncbi:DNA-binding protein [Nocardioides marmoriginsengisoli]|uniref:DNA-binding protein n=1 Tax=Nocardioides marmoriginsengisoli TaxID=661483 RepID=A0A3N0CFV4_9ACTN|nr:OB-fold domain-containing protein [Nocardioides marmoriginsengisoli]RNL62350.1 DNA-binding protein [Nocardioides marmoriginsengisoli]